MYCIIIKAIVYVLKTRYTKLDTLRFRAGRSQVFIGEGGQAGSNVKFINKNLLQNINPGNFLL